MRKSVKAVNGLTTLQVPVPPMLAKAIGYSGDARYVAFNWTPYGDEAEYFDGRRSVTGNWQAFLAYIQHPAVSPLLEGYDLGRSDSEAKHSLILDREKLELLIAPVKEAKEFLRQQWSPESPIHMSREEYSALVLQALRNVQQRSAINRDELRRFMEEQHALVEGLQQWLDRYLKN